MTWEEVRALHPDQWMVIEVLESRTEGRRWILERFLVLELCPDMGVAFNRYRTLRRADRSREYSFVTTASEKLELELQLQLSPRLYVDEPGTAR